MQVFNFVGLHARSIKHSGSQEVNILLSYLEMGELNHINNICMIGMCGLRLVWVVASSIQVCVHLRTKICVESGNRYIICTRARNIGPSGHMRIHSRGNIPSLTMSGKWRDMIDIEWIHGTGTKLIIAKLGHIEILDWGRIRLFRITNVRQCQCRSQCRRFALSVLDREMLTSKNTA